MLIYLASPYTHTDPNVKEIRCAVVQRVCAELAKRHIHVISPIAHWHPIAKDFNLPGEYDFWEELDRKMIKACDELWVADIDGWTTSKGVHEEIAYAKKLKKPLYLLNIDDFSRYTIR